MRFVVMDADPGKDDFIGQYTLPFECLEQGKVLGKVVRYWGRGKDVLGRR